MPDQNDSTIKENLDKKTTPELLDIISDKQDDYNIYAINIIKDILTSRGVPANDIIELDSKYHTIIAKTKTNVAENTASKTNKFLLWVLYIAGFAMASYIVKLAQKAMANTAVEVSKETDTTKNVWTPSYEKQVYDVLYQSADSTMIDEKAKRLFIDCEIAKIKSEYPNGIDDRDKGKLKSFTTKMAEDCLKELSPTNNLSNKWTTEFENEIIKQMLTSKQLSTVSEKYKMPFCKCYVMELKERYPNGLIGSVPQSVEDSISKICVNTIKKQMN